MLFVGLLVSCSLPHPITDVVRCSQCTENIWPSAPNLTGKVNSGTLVALLVCLAAVSAMVIAAAVLLLVVARA